MPRPSELRYSKICRLKRCKKKFDTNLEWQKFCCPEHHDEYWNEVRRDQRALLRKMQETEEKANRAEKKTEELEEKVKKLEAQKQ